MKVEPHSVFERPSVGILRTAPDGTVLCVNRTGARILGYDSVLEAATALTDPGSDPYVEPADRERLTGEIGRTGIVEGFETEFYRKDRTVVRALLNLDYLFGPGNEVVAIEGTIQDITAAFEAEEALRRAEERYRNIFENAIEGIFQVAPEGRIISANPAFARILGYESPEDLMALVRHMDAEILVSERRRNEYVQLMEVHGAVRDFEAQVYCKDRTVQWAVLNSRRVSDDKGNLLCYEGTIEDITERKKLETQLRNAQKMESIGTLAGGVAHDFNNILTTIMGYCSLIMMKAGKGNPLLGYIDQIMEAANRASTLTHSLLSFSRKQVSEIRAIDVNETIKGVEKLLRRVIGEDIELQTSLSSEKLVVIVGEGQIGQLLMNIVTNAKDAMPDGGSLSIRTQQVHLSGDITRNNDAGEGLFAAIEVCDDGSGMDETTRDQIFDPFFTTKEVGKGTGLGLSVVYGIVKQNRGFIDVTSRPGEGTSVVVYLPLAEPAAESDSLHEKAELQGGSETILVAEDNTQVREIVTTTLRDFGYDIVEAFDGADAVERFEERQGAVDLLLLDIVMPRKNGKEAYLEIKKRKPDIRTIFMSGYTGDILSRKGISREGIPMISKPIVIERLLAQIRHTLDKGPSQLTLFP
jgi:PAS domain S-box-containing protein